MPDVLIGSIKGYGWHEIEPFVVSLARTSYQGEKVMFTEAITLEAQGKLTGYGWTQVEVAADRTQDYGTARHIPVLKLLANGEWRYVVYCDVRDLVFQADPTLWLAEHLAPHALVGASECLRIADEPTNQGWIQRTLGPDVLSHLLEEPILCAGTIVGTRAAVTDLLATICELSRHISGWGYDQAYLNYLLRTTRYASHTTIPAMREGFIATCSWFLSGPERFVGRYTDEAPVFDLEAGVVRAPHTLAPFAILHQYDRGGGWDRIIREKYREASSVRS